jgi:phosphoribosylanthranilate isomerase
MLPADGRWRRTRVKMCGTTRLEDALAAVRLGVDALGFIFYPRSPRCVSLSAAKAIIVQLPPLVDRVGVFVDASIEQIIACSACGLSLLQLHGKESPEFCREVKRALPCCGIIKAFRVGGESVAADFVPYGDCVDAFLLDTYVKGAAGGTGQTFDWSLIAGLQLARPLFLAGGLAPDNVDKAIKEVQPYAVDINSGIETHPGVKDHRLLEALLTVVADLSGR